MRLAGLLALALPLFLRRPSNLLDPQLWGEDGPVFLAAALQEGFLRSVVQPFSGYLHTLPRLATGLALLAPLERTPLVLNAVAFAAQLLPAALVFSPRMAPHLGGPGRRWLAAALVVAVPNSYETYVNVTNSHWHLALAALALGFLEPARSRLATAGEAALAGLAALTGPFALLLAPVALLRWRQAAGDARRRLGRLALVLAAGALVQGALVLATPRGVGGTGGPIGATDLLRVLSTHLALDTFLGIAATLQLGELPLALHAAALLAVAALATSVVAGRDRLLQALLFLAGATVVLSFAFPVNPPAAWLDPRFGPRYFTPASLALAAAALRLALRPGAGRLLGVPLATLLLLAGIPLDFAHREAQATHWPDQVAAFRSRPAGARFLAPVTPVGYGGVTLVRDAAPPVPFALPPLPASSSLAFWKLETPRLEPGGAEGPEVLFTGTALDVRRSRGAAAVWLFIDGAPFPAAAGAPRGAPWNQPHPLVDAGAFERRVPLAEIGRGPHTLTVAIAGADGDDWLVPPPPQRFKL